MVRQAFAEASEAHVPLAGLAQRVLEVATDAGHIDATAPTFAAAATLVAVAAKKIFLFGFDVAKTRNVDSVGAISKRHFVFVAGHDCRRASAHVVVHQIVAEFTTAVGETVRKFRRRGVEQDASGFQSGGCEKNEAARALQRSLACSINHS